MIRPLENHQRLRSVGCAPQWIGARDMGAQATEIYVIQHLDQIMGTVLDRIGEMQIREVNVIDNGDGKSLAAYAASYPQMVGAVMRALKETTGVDVPAIVNREHKGGA